MLPAEISVYFYWSQLIWSLWGIWYHPSRNISPTVASTSSYPSDASHQMPAVPSSLTQPLTIGFPPEGSTVWVNAHGAMQWGPHPLSAVMSVLKFISPSVFLLPHLSSPLSRVSISTSSFQFHTHDLQTSSSTSKIPTLPYANDFPICVSNKIFLLSLTHTIWVGHLYPNILWNLRFSRYWIESFFSPPTTPANLPMFS